MCVGNLIHIVVLATPGHLLSYQWGESAEMIFFTRRAISSPQHIIFFFLPMQLCWRGFWDNLIYSYIVLKMLGLLPLPIVQKCVSGNFYFASSPTLPKIGFFNGFYLRSYVKKGSN